MDLVLVRAAHPCSDSYGHRWPAAGAVISMPRTEAVDLLAIPDAGFSEVTAPAGLPDPVPAAPVVEPAPAVVAVTEPGPAALVTEPAPVKRRPGRPRKNPAATPPPAAAAPALEGHPS